jgi:hypothetical protein
MGRNQHSIAPVPKRLRLPRAWKSPSDVVDYLRAVARQVERGRLDARIGDTLITAAKAARGAMGDVARAAELNEWRSLVARAEAVARAGEAHEVESRERMDEDDENIYTTPEPSGVR